MKDLHHEDPIIIKKETDERKQLNARENAGGKAVEYFRFASDWLR